MTAQTPELLIFQGEELALCTEPLARFPGLTPLLPPYQCPGTSLWRGYKGTWAIEADRLYLKALQRWKNVEGRLTIVGMEDLFPGYPDGVFAHWYSGELRCPRGALLQYVHGGYHSVYETDFYFRVQRGVVIDQRIVVNGKAAKTVKKGYVIGASTTFRR